MGGLATVGMLSATAFGAAPAAQASCVSAFGFSSNPAECSSTIASLAIAIGTNAEAHADGLLGAAFTVGTFSAAVIAEGSAVNLAVNVGERAQAEVRNGYFSVAINAAPFSSALAGRPAYQRVEFLNTAIQLGGPNVVVAASGVLGSAISLFGRNNQILGGYAGIDQVGGVANAAFSIFGDANIVEAGLGPLAIAASIGRTGKTVTRSTPGITINEFTLPDTAVSTPASAARTRQATRPPAAASTPKTPRPSAVTTSRGD